MTFPDHLRRHRAQYRPRHSARRAGGALRLAAAACLVVGVAVTGLIAAPAGSASSNGVWDGVAACESGNNWSINTGNGYYGGVQFSLSTWRAYGGQKYATYPNQVSAQKQIAVAQRVLYSQGPNAWPVCGPRAGLTRSNGGATNAPLPNFDTAPVNPAAHNPIKSVYHMVPGVKSVHISGWTYDPDMTGTRLGMTTRHDGWWYGHWHTARWTPRLNADRHLSGPHGFDYTLHFLRSGKHTVCLTFWNRAAGNASPRVCRSVTVG